LSGQSGMTTMLQNILIGLAGWTVLALVAGLCIGNALRICGEWDVPMTHVERNQNLKKTA
jgi:hypothetical protein